MSRSSVPPGSQMRVEPEERLDVLLASAPEPERAADEDGPVATREIERVHRLDVQVRREPSRSAFSRQSAIMSADTSQPSTSSPARKYGTRSRPVPQATSRAGCAVVFDELLEVRDLVRPEVVVELRPVPRDEPVVPGLRLLVGHASREAYDLGSARAARGRDDPRAARAAARGAHARAGGDPRSASHAPARPVRGCRGARG